MGLVATLILEAQFLERRPLGKYVPELVVFAELNMEYCFASWIKEVYSLKQPAHFKMIGNYQPEESRSLCQVQKGYGVKQCAKSVGRLNRTHNQSSSTKTKEVEGSLKLWKLSFSESLNHGWGDNALNKGSFLIFLMNVQQCFWSLIVGLTVQDPSTIRNCRRLLGAACSSISQFLLTIWACSNPRHVDPALVWSTTSFTTEAAEFSSWDSGKVNIGESKSVQNTKFLKGRDTSRTLPFTRNLGAITRKWATKPHRTTVRYIEIMTIDPKAPKEHPSMWVTNFWDIYFSIFPQTESEKKPCWTKWKMESFLHFTYP